jgi:hypothetical protein
MPRTITIRSGLPGQSLDSTLQDALALLRSNHIKVLAAAAQNNDRAGHNTATILLSYLDDRPRALQILNLAGIPVEK